MNTAAVLLKEAMQAMHGDPARAAALCRAALQDEPRNFDAALLLSEALRLSGDLVAARDIVAPIAAANSRQFGAQRQLGVILAAMHVPVPASIALRAAANANAAHPTIWRDLADQLALAGDLAGARAAYARHAASPAMEPKLASAGVALRSGDITAASEIISAYLAAHPTDVSALRMMAEAHARGDQYDKAEAALRRAIQLAPTFGLSRHELSQMLMGLGRVDEALIEARSLLALDANNPGSRRLVGAVLNARGDYSEAVEIYQKLLAEDPKRAPTWTTLGHVLKTMGRTEEGVAAYRTSIALAPGSGDAYWGLANLKTVRLDDADVAQIRAQLDRSQITQEDRVSLFYTLGKALEQRGDTAGAFAAYAEGAAVRVSFDKHKHDADALSGFVDATIAQQDARFFTERAGAGEDSPDPIFVLGLPRSGSTLVEQILASHSQIEGTMELPDMLNLVRDLSANSQDLAELDPGALRALGESYLRTTRSRRKQGTPYFIDKMPNNWMHVGLIQLILPNARIIDTRRHPMACGWSCFKQHFPLGHSFSYELTGIGRYYADYVRLMAHYDAVLPGCVHRVIHEELITDPEPHIRALLAYCGLPFDEQCLRPHETKRAVHTASAEQVRQPISAGGLDDWRAFERYLGPLKAALGPALDAYPSAPR